MLYIYTCTYVYISIDRRSKPISSYPMYIYIYINTHITYLYVYIYSYLHTMRYTWIDREYIYIHMINNLIYIIKDPQRSGYQKIPIHR